MKWSQPPVIKIYEALGAVADERVAVSGNTAKVYSSSGNKFYDVSFDPKSHAIMANDNGSYWKGYLGYPSIAFLFKIGVLEYNPKLARLLKGIKWKDLNQNYKNDFDKTLNHILLSLNVGERKLITEYVKKTEVKLSALDLALLGNKIRPPVGY